MAKKRYTPEKIGRKRIAAEVLQCQGQAIAEVVKQLGITAQTFYRSRKEYGGMRVDQVKRLKELEAENAEALFWISGQFNRRPIMKTLSPGGNQKRFCLSAGGDG